MATTRSGPGCGYCAASPGNTAANSRMNRIGKRTDLVCGRIGGSSWNKKMKLTEVWRRWKGATKNRSIRVCYGCVLPSPGRQPSQHVARIPVRGENRVEDVLDPAITDHQRQTF